MRDWRDYPGAPAPGTCLGALGDAPPGLALVYECGEGAALFRAFVIVWNGQPYAYVNDCPHAHTPLDWLPGQVMDADRRYLICATHGALFEPATGQCVSGPCRGKGLTAIPIQIQADQIFIAP